MTSPKRSKSAQFPLTLGSTGTFRLVPSYQSQIRFLLSFPIGPRFWDPTYGTNLPELEQATSELDDILPLQLIQLHQNLLRVRGIIVEQISATRSRLQSHRTIGITIDFHKSGERTRERLEFERTLLWQF